MADVFRLADELGPEKILHVHNAAIGLKAICVVDNTAAGPSIGGIRMAPDASLDECARLARAMTLKNAAAQLPHGGGKSVIVGDPHMEPERKDTLIRAFAAEIASESGYVPGPDMGTNEAAMAAIRDEGGRAVGLPRVIGGIPLDEIGATGFGLAVAARVAAPRCGIDLDGARVAIQGFGAVGIHAARFLAEEGATVVAVADSSGVVMRAEGLDLDALVTAKRNGVHVTDTELGEIGDPESIVSVDCDIWIPAARPDVLRADNAGSVSAKLILEGANIPATAEAESMLGDAGVLVVPDFIANAGGVICAAVEFHGGTERAAFDAIEEKISGNVEAILDRAATEGIGPREAAVALAHERVIEAMRYRRWSRQR